MLKIKLLMIYWMLLLLRFFSRAVIGAMGGRRAIAGTAAKFQTPGAVALKQLINRGIAVGGTNIINSSSEAELQTQQQSQ